MKSYRTALIVFALQLTVFALPTTAEPSETTVAELEQLMRDYYGALNRGDAIGAERAWSKTRNTSEYSRHGGLLEVFPPQSLEEAAAKMEAAIERGLDLDLEIQHLHVEPYGDSAVATLYSTGTVTFPDGRVEGGTARVSYFLVRERAGWKIVHMHSSPVRIGDAR